MIFIRVNIFVLCINNINTEALSWPKYMYTFAMKFSFIPVGLGLNNTNAATINSRNVFFNL